MSSQTPPQPLPQGERGLSPEPPAPPSLPGKGFGGSGHWLPFVVFFLFLGLWTWKLLESNPVPEKVTQGWSLDLKFIAAKTLHVGAYGFLTLLAAWLPVRRPYFWATIGLLMLHAIGTEIGQSYVPNRHGSVTDVLIDWLGIALGLIFLRLWRTYAR